MSFGDWPTNMNLDSVSSGTQSAFGFWGGDASNALDIVKDQQAGLLYEETVDGNCTCTPVRTFDSRVLNIERISSGNQFATATGGSTATNSITVDSKQCTPQAPVS
jgi:hypothetical protein